MVSNARLDLPLPLGPVTTVSLPSGRSTSIALRLFWRAPRIWMQSFASGPVTRSFFATFEPTGNDSRLRRGSQISGGSAGASPAVSRASRDTGWLFGGGPAVPHELRVPIHLNGPRGVRVFC